MALAVVIALVAWRTQGVPASARLLRRPRRPAPWRSTSWSRSLISRDRPPVEILDPGLVPDHSFPSGHVATAVVVYCALAVHLLRTVPSSRRWAWPLYAVPLIVAATRLYQGAHHPTDVLTSLVLAPLWVAAVATVVLPRPDKVEA